MIYRTSYWFRNCKRTWSGIEQTIDPYSDSGRIGVQFIWKFRADLPDYGRKAKSGIYRIISFSRGTA